MQLSSLIGKKIISPTGEELGYVTGAYLSRDLTSLAALTAVDGDEEEFVLPIRAVIASSDAIIAQKSRAAAPVGVPAPIGLRAFSETGEDLGVVGDWLFGDCEPVFILVKDDVRTGYAAETVLAEENVVVYLSGERPAPKKRAKKKIVTSETKNEATMSANTPAENASKKGSAVQEETANEEAAMPSGASDTAPSENDLPAHESTEPQEQTVKFELGTRNLLGKRVVRSVYDAQGEIVALAGDRITPEVLSRARRKGRLLALTVNTLTNVY